MAWPGSTPPANARRPRHRRGKGNRRINAKSSLERLVVRIARREKVTGPAKKTTEVRGVCLSHCFEQLGFSSPWAAATYIDELFRRHPRAKTVRLPKEKRPEGVRLVIAVRCRLCNGRGCQADGGYGVGCRYILAIPTKACTKHEAAPR